MSPSCVYTASGEYVCGGGGDGSRTSFGGDVSRTSFGGYAVSSCGGGGVPVSTSQPSSCSSFYHDTYAAMKSPSHPQRHFEEVWKNFNGQDAGLRPMAIAWASSTDVSKISSKISLRLIDWFVTNYAKTHNVVIHSPIASLPLNVYRQYRMQLKAYSKQQFDPFRRRDRILFHYGSENIETTVGQLNFFRWMIENRILEYVEEHEVLTDASLTDDSPTDDPPKCGRVALWKHQSAMLRRCHCIEAYGRKLRIITRNAEKNDKSVEIAVGIMNDPPGCGKTFVMLALLASEPDSVNLVVVPPNLHHQWVEAAERYLPQSFPRTTIVEYSQTIMLYTDAEKVFKKNRLIITTTTFVDSISSALANHTPLDRVIVDEVDTAIYCFRHIPPCHRMWFLSASFKPSQLLHLNFSISGVDIGGLVCRCEHSFMTKCHGLDVPPETTLIRVPDGDISLFLGLHDAHTITLMNALDIDGAKARVLGLYKSDRAASVRELAILYLTNLDRLACIPGVRRRTYKSLRMRAKVLRKRLSAPPGPSGDSGKLDAFDAFFRRSEKDGDWDGDAVKKCIIFSDADAIFYKVVEPRLDRAGIGYVTLQGGTVLKNEQAVYAYRNDPAVRVLLLNSAKDGCGLNLEVTTHILLLHRTAEALVEQVVGRAQRPGRT
eukprot:gene25492-11148_t